MTDAYVTIDDKTIYDISNLVTKNAVNRVGFFSFDIPLKRGINISDVGLTKECKIYANKNEHFVGVIDKRERISDRGINFLHVEGRDRLSSLLSANCIDADFENKTVAEIIKGTYHPFGNSSFEEGLDGWITYSSTNAGTETLRPNGDSIVELSAEPGTGESNYEDVDESTADDDSTYVYLFESGSYDPKSDLYTIQNTSTEGEDTINWVRVTVRCRWYGSAGDGTKGKWYAYAQIKTHGTTYESSQFDLEDYNPDYGTFSYTWTTNPNTGNAWTWTEINDLIAGVKLYCPERPQNPDGSPINTEIRCTQVYVQVSYGAITNFVENTDTTYVYEGIKSAKFTTEVNNASATLKKRIYLDPDDKPDTAKVRCRVYYDGTPVHTSDTYLKLSNSSGSSTYTFADSGAGGNEWACLETSIDVSDDCYFDIEITAASDSGTDVYVDAVEYCYNKVDYDSNFYDNGILFGLDENLTSSIECTEEISKFTTSHRETRLSALNRLLNLLDRSKYLFYMKSNCFYLKEREATNNITLNSSQYNVIQYSEDCRDLKHTCTVYSRGTGEDWFVIQKDVGYNNTGFPYCLSTLTVNYSGTWYDLILGGFYVDGSNPGKIDYTTDEGETWTTSRTLTTNGSYPYSIYYDEDNDKIYVMTRHDGILSNTPEGILSGSSWTEEVDSGDYYGQMIKLTNPSDNKEYLFTCSQDSANSNRPTIWRKELPSGSWTAIDYDTDYIYSLGLNGHGSTLIVSYYNNTTNSEKILIKRCTNPFDASPTFTTVKQVNSTYNAIYWITKRFNKQLEDYEYYASFEKTAGGGTVFKGVADGTSWVSSDDQTTTFAARCRHIFVTDYAVYACWEGDNTNNHGGIRLTTDEGETWTTDIAATEYKGYLAMTSLDAYLYASECRSSTLNNLIRKVEPYTIKGYYQDSTAASSYGDEPRFHEYLDISDVRTLRGVNKVAEKYVNTHKDIHKIIKINTKLDLNYQLLSYVTLNTDEDDINGSYYVVGVDFYFPDRCILTLDNNPYTALDMILHEVQKEIKRLGTSINTGRVIDYNSTNRTATVDFMQVRGVQRLYRVRSMVGSLSIGDIVTVLGIQNEPENSVIIAKQT